MRTHTFWHILQTAFARSLRQQNPIEINVIGQLSKLDIEQIVSFAQIYYGYDAALTCAEVKSVFQEIRPTGTATEFIALRAWVIFQGLDFLTLVHSSPKLLPQLCCKESFTNPYAGVVVRAYERKTKKRNFYELPEIIKIVDQLPDC